MRTDKGKVFTVRELRAAIVKLWRVRPAGMELSAFLESIANDIYANYGSPERIRYGENGRVFAYWLRPEISGYMFSPDTEEERRIAEIVWEQATKQAYKYARRGDLCRSEAAMANPYKLTIDDDDTVDKEQ